MTNENNKKNDNKPCSEIILTLVYTVIVVLFMWGLSFVLN